jgi:hypothetical protein
MDKQGISECERTQLEISESALALVRGLPLQDLCPMAKQFAIHVEVPAESQGDMVALMKWCRANQKGTEFDDLIRQMAHLVDLIESEQQKLLKLYGVTHDYKLRKEDTQSYYDFMQHFAEKHGKYVPLK